MVILDTNFLLIPHQFRINIIAELEKLIESAHELVVGEPVRTELEGLAKGRTKEGVAAKVALEALRRGKLKEISSGEKDADRWILDYCTRNPGTIVCTNDIELRKKLKGTGTRIITMRTRTRIFWA